MAKKLNRNAMKPGHRLHWYEIREILGQGGFGITYLARDLNLDEDVAIKEYLPVELAVREGDRSVNPLSEDHGQRYQDGLRKFIEEARTLNRFRHPNIIRVRGVFEANNTAYMVMDYEAGETLKDRLGRCRTLNEAELLTILLPLMDGLEHIHARGYAHRDIKPANVFIRGDGTPVLLDFGSARQTLGANPHTVTSFVSPGYAPLEQYHSRSDAQGPWTDIYGVGATLYRAICGCPPADAVDRSQHMLTHSRDALLSAVEVGAGRYSRRVLAAIDHALALRPDDRPRSVVAWRSEISGCMSPMELSERTVAATTVIGTERLNPHPGARRSSSIRSMREWTWRVAVVIGVVLNIAYVGTGSWKHFETRIGPAAAPAQVMTERADIAAPVSVVKPPEANADPRRTTPLQTGAARTRTSTIGV